MAMKFDLEELNPGTFFPFDEEENPDEGVTLRVLNSEALDAINRACRIKKVEVRGSPASRFEFLDFKKEGEEREFKMTWDYCIIDWKGVVNSNGQEIPCTSENKVKLMRGSPAFSSFVTVCAGKINKASEEYEEELEKNL